jgi:hypothetical protein
MQARGRKALAWAIGLLLTIMIFVVLANQVFELAGHLGWR